MSEATPQDLVRLLAEHDIAIAPAAARELLAGWIAAPPVGDVAHLAALFQDDPDPALAGALADLIARVRAAARKEGQPDHGGRLAALRRAIADDGLDGLLVPMADEYQNEYVPARAKRIAWLSGFTGSAGLIVVLGDRAAIFTDGRYTLQVADQVDAADYEIRHITEAPPADWLAEHIGEGARIGYDPWLFTPDAAQRLRETIEGAGGALVPCDENPLDRVWRDQPAKPLAPVYPHDGAYAGESSADKRQRIAADLANAKLDAAVVTAPDSIAWLLNLRGGDVAHTPLPLSLLILHRDGHADLFVDRRKLVRPIDGHLGNAVTVNDETGFGAALDDLGADGRRVLVDPALSADWVFRRLGAAGAEIARQADPCQLPKACKNPVEIAGTRAAHLRDGGAVTRFLCWLDREAAAGGVDEIAAANRLEAFRRENGGLRDLSFTTISGAGPNGAIVHYGVSPETNRRLEPGSLYLVDSGAQYPDGTTDITRTIAVGAPSDEMRERFTRVLKGHIALARAIFPVGTTGSQLDTLARMYLWQAGLDFDHGTGHGVGSFLGVHEGPARISKIPNAVALRPGMILSNEPGYYKTGAYGIRIENLVTVIPAPDADGFEREMLAFETLTRAPIDLALVETAMLDDGERAWLNRYHESVRNALAGDLDAETGEWLERATRAI